MDAATNHVIRKIGLRRNPAATRAALVCAARQEFEECGFDATQSSNIARRAGYAPQTFYRHFADKVDILLAAYADWHADEQHAISTVGDAREAARVLLRYHRASMKLRQALRTLSITEERVRAARAKSRMRSVAYLRTHLPHAGELGEAQLLRSVLLLERTVDAYAEDDLADPNTSPDQAEQRLCVYLQQEFGPPSQAA